jgi:UDP-glucose 4-epimerase
MVLVTGASGALGPSVVRALCEKKYRVRVFCRNLPVKDDFPANVEIHRGDVTIPLDIRAAMGNVKSVIHLAALLHIFNPPDDLSGLYEEINVRGTLNVVNESIRTGVRRVVFLSTVSVYGQSRGEVLTEDSPANPDTYYSRSKLKAERIVLEAQVHDAPIGTVLRLGAVYGPRVKGNYRKLLMALARHRFIQIGAGQNRRTLIYDKDAANAIIAAMNHPHVAGKLYNVSDGSLHTLNEIVEAMCLALGRKKSQFSLPLKPFHALAVLIEGVSRIMGIRHVAINSMIDKYVEDMAVSDARFQEEAGFVPQYNLLAGWQETVDKMRRCGDLSYKA